jgi:hypothetical protein
MKTQQEATIYFRGYPLSIIEPNQKTKKNESGIVKSMEKLNTFSSKDSIANDPKNWDVDWFNSYE